MDLSQLGQAAENAKCRARPVNSQRILDAGSLSMPRELITIQVGQCGNQIGGRFWDMALREHAAINQKGIFDEAMSRSAPNRTLSFSPVSLVR